MTDSWLNHAVLGEARPFHPFGLPPLYVTDAATFGIDEDAAPAFKEVVAVRNERMARVRAFVDAVTQETLTGFEKPITPQAGHGRPSVTRGLACR